MKVVAKINEDNIISLNIELEVGTLNQLTFLGNYENVRKALTESVLNQAKNGDRQGVEDTLEEMYKLRFWEILGVEQGAIEIRDGKLFGLNKKVELDDSLQALVDSTKVFKELNE
ncbi:hypothetical protein M5X00_26340 [Paenibacillus alvei]|uniref:hypothetical protein n=1 Tax=Paenibacillus alvei TaxID=44250 RepID=UPI0022832994|nr:hypothetical protein [Paenibacillus alvei]MCY9757752.1 hypothetical protein [Paenibacillus alvei]